MFAGLISTLSLVVGMFALLLFGVMVGIHPWLLLIYVPLFFYSIRRAWRWFTRICDGAPLDTARLYPPGFVKAAPEQPHQFIEPITMGGHNRDRHG